MSSNQAGGWNDPPKDIFKGSNRSMANSSTAASAAANTSVNTDSTIEKAELTRRLEAFIQHCAQVIAPNTGTAATMQQRVLADSQRKLQPLLIGRLKDPTRNIHCSYEYFLTVWMGMMVPRVV
jgi:hypothetical protein